MIGKIVTNLSLGIASTVIVNCVCAKILGQDNAVLLAIKKLKEKRKNNIKKIKIFEIK